MYYNYSVLPQVLTIYPPSENHSSVWSCYNNKECRKGCVPEQIMFFQKYFLKKMYLIKLECKNNKISKTVNPQTSVSIMVFPPSNTVLWFLLTHFPAHHFPQMPINCSLRWVSSVKFNSPTLKKFGIMRNPSITSQKKTLTNIMLMKLSFLPSMRSLMRMTKDSMRPP